MTTNLVVVNVNVIELLFVLQHLNQLFGTVVIDIIIRKLDFLQSSTTSHKLTDFLASDRADSIIRKAENMKTLSLLI